MKRREVMGIELLDVPQRETGEQLGSIWCLEDCVESM